MASEQATRKRPAELTLLHGPDDSLFWGAGTRYGILRCGSERELYEKLNFVFGKRCWRFVDKRLG